MEVNSVVISGNLTRDPKLRDAGGTALCRLRIACSRRVKDRSSGDWRDEPQYFDVDVWGRSGEACNQYLSKGSTVVVQGELRWREWEQDGNKRSAVSISAFTVKLPRRESSDGYSKGYEPPAQQSAPAPSGGRPMEAADQFGDEDIPF
jgi:single-strand DNA-binding protein